MTMHFVKNWSRFSIEIMHFSKIETLKISCSAMHLVQFLRGQIQTLSRNCTHADKKLNQCTLCRLSSDLSNILPFWEPSFSLFWLNFLRLCFGNILSYYGCILVTFCSISTLSGPYFALPSQFLAVNSHNFSYSSYFEILAETF